MKRVYVHDEEYQKIMNWAKNNFIKSVNGKYTFGAALKNLVIEIDKIEAWFSEWNLTNGRKK